MMHYIWLYRWNVGEHKSELFSLNISVKNFPIQTRNLAAKTVKQIVLARISQVNIKWTKAVMFSAASRNSPINMANAAVGKIHVQAVQRRRKTKFLNTDGNSFGDADVNFTAGNTGWMQGCHLSAGIWLLDGCDRDVWQLMHRAVAVARARWPISDRRGPVCERAGASRVHSRCAVL